MGRKDDSTLWSSVGSQRLGDLLISTSLFKMEDVLQLSSQDYCSAFHILRHPGPAASSRSVSAHFKWDNVKKHS